LQISAEVKDLAKRARDNKLKPEEFMGGSFSISNLGMFGIDSFSAIVNPPQACIMAVGGARQGVTMGEGGVVKGRVYMTASISADNRVFDGETAGAFLEAFQRHMESPATLFM
jgi:pyruvate dehydrogenase E2 component (dihydrolipoamide acetyltransferase)